MRVHELTQREIVKIRDTLDKVLQLRAQGDDYPHAYLLVKDEDEADGDDVTLRVTRESGQFNLRMLAIR